jgi:hypothetical protein
MPLRLAFDLDGVLADMDGALVQQAEGLFGEAMTKRLLDGSTTASTEPAREVDDPTAARIDSAKTANASQTAGATSVEDAPPIVRLQLTARQTRRLWHHIGTVENFWEGLKEIEPGAIARLGALAADRRWEVIFLTKRPASGGATAQMQTQRWLESKGFAYPSVYVVQASRGRIAASLELDFVIDDRPENCLDVVVDSKARAILVWRDNEKQLPAAAKRLGIGVVKTMEECLNILMQVDSPATHGKPHLLDRVKQLLGLKEPTAPS